MKSGFKQVLVLGGGVWGKNIIRTLYNMNRLEAVVEPNVHTQAELRKEFSGLSVFSSIPNKLSPRSTAVAICTPAVTHFAIASKLLREGFDVFVEKPMTMDPAEAEQLNKLARDKKAVLMVGHVFLYSEAIQFTAKLLHGNVIGKITHVHLERKNWGRLRKEESIVWSLSPHDFSILLYLFGDVPKLASAAGRSFSGSDRIDQVVADFVYPSGLGATLSLSWMWPEKVRRVTLLGNTGMIVCDSGRETVTLYANSIAGDEISSNLQGELLFKGTRPALELEMENFCDVLQTRREPVANGVNAAKVVSLVEKFDKSVFQKVKQKLRRVA